MKKSLFVLSGFIISFLGLYGQVYDEDTLTNKQLDEVVISAQYIPQSEKNAIYKVKIISAEVIEQKAATNLGELLQQELNIELSQNSVFGTSLEFQGISKENIKIHVDGVPVIGRLNGIIDLNQIDLSNVARVEIIEGPVSVFYGTDAMGGIINIITKKSPVGIMDSKVSAYYESINALDFNANLGYKFKENALRISGGYHYFKGLSTNEMTEDIRNKNWEKRNQYSVTAMYNRKIKNLNLRLNSNFSNQKNETLGDPDKPRGNIEDKDYFTRRIDNAINLTGPVFKDHFINIIGSYSNYNRYHNTYNVDTVTFESVLSDTDLKEDNVVKYNYGGVKAQIGKSQLSEKFNYAFGFDINFESTEGERILDLKQKLQTVALLASINYKVHANFEMQPSVRYSWNSSSKSFLSPAFNAKYHINENNQLRASYALGYRAPSLKELFLDLQMSIGPNTIVISGNEDLKVERSHAVNIYYTYKKHLDNSGMISIEPSFFFNNISNLIGLSETVDFKRHYINIDKFKSVGGKFNVTYNPIENLSLSTGYSLTGRYNKFTENFESDKFAFGHEVLARAHYNIEKIDLGFNLFYKYSSKRKTYSLNTTEDELIKATRESYNNLDFSISKSFFNQIWRISVGAKNILNVEDLETINDSGEAHSRDMQLWGRSFFVKTTFSFSK